MDLYLVRHTEPAVAPGICYGRCDVNLSSSGVAAMAAVAEQLRPLLPAPVISSPLRRCRRLAAHLGRPVHLEPALRELDFGRWEGRAWDTVPTCEWQPWGTDWVHNPPPAGESLQQLAHRSVTCLWRLLRRYQACERLIIITHAGVIRALHATLTGTPLERAWDQSIAYGAIRRLASGPEGWRQQPPEFREGWD